MEHLIKRWNIADVNCESGEAAAAQEFLMKQPARIRGLAEFGARKTAKKAPVRRILLLDLRTPRDGSPRCASTRRRRRGRAFDPPRRPMSAAAASHGGARRRRAPWARRDGVASGATLRITVSKHRTLERSSARVGDRISKSRAQPTAFFSFSNPFSGDAARLAPASEGDSSLPAARRPCARSSERTHAGVPSPRAVEVGDRRLHGASKDSSTAALVRRLVRAT